MAATAANYSQTDLLGRSPVLHLLRRATFGPTPALVAQATKMGVHAWLEQQLAPSSIPDPLGAKITAAYPHLAWSIPQVRAALKPGAWDVMQDLAGASIARQIWSSRQLFEVMVDFWSNHLNVTNLAEAGWDCRHLYDRDVIRAHALGSFTDMLIAAIKHPAMLRYLNNDASTKDNPNENLGRELLELHTVSLAAGYSETDMHNSAMILTGLGVAWQSTNEYQYWPDDHYTGPVKVMGFTSANATAAGGEAVAEAYLRYLATHPQTALHLAGKLATRFVSDTPPQALVQRLAQVYLSSGTQIVPVLRALFTSPEFAASIGQKTRRPAEDLVAAARTLGVGMGSGPTVWLQMVWVMWSVGQAPMHWPQPDGYPDVAAAWVNPSNALGVLHAQENLAGGWWPDKLSYQNYLQWLPAKRPPTWGGVVDALAQRLLYTPLKPEHRAAVLALAGKKSTDRVNYSNAAWTVVGYIVPLLLHSPYHSAR